ncbi:MULTISPECIES: NAD(P)/FAD-dependent oxidoreductase [unclassified Bradyrhizobium]|uniref:flavin-containing monooxygenase n=1 Tax=unclassified Bradyrhizobium TaxID=2631580 RepID=UPI001BA5BC30|nr:MULTISPECIES: NAD(P)/FAD-dependent oxidoreductase [unclassified Bradyrhizobium]MBR1202958.1 NAD(P)/FAD-dependent oxidoreductase [Bradyrhizobium sp. AUGA SZCCT0124]MBR1314372.1 NAD(P)/FAD-dependent oxidoreductase [Bradyrhizobium sp. AUGA SZCCT0051]MBR1342610.1 NAD(P)/FAD-dependent oxidoreductase [Bradyrhizobium sp. AUGA SZCCT0105]MBR1352839.1 NAD(P)/FAD-dependent oxidoreductase [Bradyrhizobium sp. AUGA SZCCT0045]
MTGATISDPPGLINQSPGFDPQALRAKYLAERDKRLRIDGIAQYQEITGKFARFGDDPYVSPGFTRVPLSDEADVVVIGGGFGGLLAGARLRDAGVRDIRIIEKGGDFGGTWYWNRYPGAACDIESYVYLPLLEETGFVPTEKYVCGPEILEHHRRIGRHYDLYKGALFQTEVTSMHWDEQADRWIVRTNRGDAIRSRFLALASGPLHRPKLPGVPGLETFNGKVFHTSRWDYEYTGGSERGALAGLGDKRVGIIGTGATAVQCVPHLGAAAKHLYVFQRTPSSVDVRNNQPTDPAWVAGLEAGWQKRRMDNFNILTSGGHQDEDLVNDGWTDIIRNILLMVRTSSDVARAPAEMAEHTQLADFKKMEQIRARVDAIVQDPQTAEALKPYYNQFCKRPCFHDDYLPTFNRPNVTLVDTRGRGIERITEGGVVVDDKEYGVDCLIFATGFEVGTSYTRRAGFELYGGDGTSLTDYWSNGVRTLHGMHVRGFPNCFIMSIAQAALAASYPHMLNEQAKHIAHIVTHARDRQATRVEASAEAEEAWIEKVKSLARLRQKFQEECTPGYYNNEGRPNPVAMQNSPYGAGPVAFIKVLEAWREEGGLQGLEVS